MGAINHSAVRMLRPREDVLVSVVIPIYNEAGKIPLLCERLFGVLRASFPRFEVIAVNDGSRDASLHELQDEAAIHHELKIVDLRRNCGQTAALMAGIDHASAEIIVMIDADLQNDPEDIPHLVSKLGEATTWCRVGAKTGRTRL